ncbi:MAG: site-2 protease family protein, partial [Candidatus Nanohaloarchaea archaeon]
ILGIIPGAFVEPKGENMLPRKNEDTEEALKKEKEDSGGMWDQGTWKQRLQVLTAGSFANYVTAVLFFLLATATVIGSTTIAESGYIGVQLQPVDKGLNYTAIEGYPAFESGMRNGTLYSINGTSIESYEDLQNISEGLKPNTTIVLETSEGVFTIETVAKKYREFKPGVMPFSGLMQWFIDLLRMVAYLNFVVGFFNMLPAKPLDGGQVVDTFLERFYPAGRGLLNYWSLLVWAGLIGALALGISVSIL